MVLGEKVLPQQVQTLLCKNALSDLHFIGFSPPSGSKDWVVSSATDDASIVKLHLDE
jgi:hypothetical protein